MTMDEMHLRRDLVVENFHMRRLCDGKWERLQNILADPGYPAARPLCAACRSMDDRTGGHVERPTLNQIIEAALSDALSDDDGLEICTACGVETHGVEPDAREYKCDGCGALAERTYGDGVRRRGPADFVAG